MLRLSPTMQAGPRKARGTRGQPSHEEDNTPTDVGRQQRDRDTRRRRGQLPADGPGSLHRAKDATLRGGGRNLAHEHDTNGPLRAKAYALDHPCEEKLV